MSNSERFYTLWGFGFNAFGQLNVPEGGGERGRTDAIPDSGVEIAGLPAKTEGAQNTEIQQQDEFAVYTPRKLAAFSTQPLLHISSSWDALHCHVESGSGGQCVITTGRWSNLREEVQQELATDEEVVCILEAMGIMLLQTTSRTLLTSLSNPHKLHLVDCNIPSNAILCSLSDGRIHALLDNGNVYQCSTEVSNGSISASLGPQMNMGVPISHISCGADHLLLLSRSGCVFSLGLGSRGQLGHGDILPRKEPSVIEALAGVTMKSVACGSWHSLSLSEYGDVYSWGWNEHGQLGHSGGAHTPSAVPLPTLIENPNGDMNFAIVRCGARHSAAVTEGGQLYTWGWNEYGQLGNGQVGGISALPTQSSVLHRISFVHCGHWNTVVIADLHASGDII